MKGKRIREGAGALNSFEENRIVIVTKLNSPKFLLVSKVNAACSCFFLVFCGEKESQVSTLLSVFYVFITNLHIFKNLLFKKRGKKDEKALLSPDFCMSLFDAVC